MAFATSRRRAFNRPKELAFSGSSLAKAIVGEPQAAFALVERPVVGDAVRDGREQVAGILHLRADSGFAWATRDSSLQRYFRSSMPSRHRS